MKSYFKAFDFGVKKDRERDRQNRETKNEVQRGGGGNCKRKKCDKV